MPTADDLLLAYYEARSLEEAVDALDDLAPSDDLPAPLLGDRYDDLATEVAEAGEYALAVRLQRRAVELGCRLPELGREMLAWYLLKDGATVAGEAEFARLRTERPDDVDLLIALGNARADAGLHEASLTAFDDAVELARRSGSEHELEWARIERRGERELLGLPLDDDDDLVARLRPRGDEQIVVCTLAWFPPDQHAAALERWPSLAEDLDEPRAYARRLEAHLRQLHRETGRHPSIAPLNVEELTHWATAAGEDPDSGSARSRFAAELGRTGRALPWPPGRNDACWCRSGRKYKRCCGAD
ncbi:MAG TPA: SEC-C metal-binding domain-containing protein [Solirubrobacteraceae bacterium]|nr:SEC-C metal-binding domain-containing protein [Solirubrobacteraceae bacterium]